MQFLSEPTEQCFSDLEVSSLLFCTYIQLDVADTITPSLGVIMIPSFHFIFFVSVLRSNPFNLRASTAKNVLISFFETTTAIKATGQPKDENKRNAEERKIV